MSAAAHTVVNLVLPYALNSIWQIPLMGCAGWVACRLFQPDRPAWQYRVWILCLLAATLLPAAGICRAWISSRGGVNPSLLRILTDTGSSPARPSQQAAGGIALPPVAAYSLLAVYGLGLLAALSRLFASIWQTHRLLGRSRPAALSAEAMATWEQCGNAFASGPAAIRVVRGLAGPVTCGWKQNVLLLPEDFLKTSTTEEITAALGHEAAHMERRDFLWNSVAEIVTVTIAYHPLAWWMKAQLAQSRESVCDQMTAERLLDRHTYAASLLTLASRISGRHRSATVHAIGMFDANILEKRIMMLTSHHAPMEHGRRILSIAAAFILAAASVTAAVALAPTVSQVDASSTRTIDSPDKVYAVGNGVSAPMLTFSVDPEFPRNSGRRAPFNGVCVLKVVVDRNGKISQAAVVRSLGPSFDNAALAAVKKFRFKPARLNGEAVAVSIQVETNYRRY